MTQASNQLIVDKLREMADLLEVQHEDGYRIAAYRRAAKSLEQLAVPVEQIARKDGLKGLMELPGIGRGIASAIMEMVVSGRWSQFDRLSGTLDPEQLFQTVAGIGAGTAARIHDELHIDTLEQLEQAALDGRLAHMKGIGPRRTSAIKGALSERLGHRHFRTASPQAAPAVSLVLDVDREYLEKAGKDELRKIAPKRFNPSNEAWLPVLHTRRGDWQFTVLFSNTQRAHDLGKTRDWVVVYFHADAEPEAQCTIVTESRGPLAGRRVVRGREGDCLAHYAEEGR